MSKGKSSKDRNARLDNLFGGSAPKAGAQPAARPRVGAGVVGAAELNLLRDENTQLKAALEGAEIADLDLEAIDPSPYPDRLDGQDESDGFTQLKVSLEAHGQEVPILVRPHPNAKGRYQTVFGHRRVRAMRELGRDNIRAGIRALDDEALLIAQGLENAARQDLSWIEKALFARKLEAFATANGRDATQMVLDALAIHAPEASRYRTVIDAVGDKIILSIGAAPKIGRTKWMALAEALRADKKAAKHLQTVLANSEVKALPSDQRFAAALTAGLPSGNREVAEAINAADGTAIAAITRKTKVVRFDLEDKEFADFLKQRLKKLYAEYQGTKQ